MYLQNITKKFLNGNKELIDKDDWGEILIKASSLGNNFPIEDLISLIKEVGRAEPKYAPYRIGDEVKIDRKSQFLMGDLSKTKPWSNNYKSKENLKKAIERIQEGHFDYNNDVGTIIDMIYSKDNPFIYLVKIKDSIWAYPFYSLSKLGG